MTRKNNFIIVFIMLSTVLLHAQAKESDEQLKIYNSGFTQGALSSWNQEKTTAAYYYPAEANYDNISIYCSIGKWANTPLYSDIYTNGQYVLPSFVSIGIPISNFMISVGYNNYYNARIHTSLSRTTMTNPDETGETTEYESNTKLHSFFNSIKYKVSENISLGVLLGYNILSESAHIGSSGISGNGYGYSLKASLLWEPTNSLSIGFNYGFISSIDYVIEDESSDIEYVAEIPGAGNAVLVETEFKRKGSFPLSYSVKVGYKIQPNVSFDLSIERQTWDIIETDENSVINIRFRSSYRVTEQIVLNVGYFTHNHPFGGSTMDYWMMGSLYKNLQYFNVGIDYVITDSIVLNLSAFDSSQLSEDKYSQTYFSSAISIEL